MNLIEQIKVNDVSIDGYQGTYYSESPEWIKVITDSEDKVLAGIRADGTKVIGGDFNIGGSTSISEDIRVLGNMEISGVSYKVIENSEFLAAWLDAENKVIFGLKADGKTYVCDADFLNEIKNNQEAINEIKSYLANFDNLDIDALSSITAVENPEYLKVELDAEDKVLSGIKVDGSHYAYNMYSETIDAKVDKEEGKSLIDKEVAESLSAIEDLERRSEIITDSEGKIISYRDSDGVKHEEVGIEADNIKVKYLTLTENGLVKLQSDLDNSNVQIYKRPNIPYYGTANIKTETFYLTSGGWDSYNDDVVLIQMYDETEENAQNKLTLSYFYIKSTLTPLASGGYDRTSVNESSIKLDFYAATEVTKVGTDFYVTDSLEDGQPVESSIKVAQCTDIPPYKAWSVDKTTEHYCLVDIDFGDYYKETDVAIGVKYQGSSTLQHKKRNFRFTFYKNNSYKKKNKVKFGEMQRLSGYNLKANAMDGSRVKELVLYAVLLSVWEQRPENNRFPWNNEFSKYTNATGFIVGFPISLYIGNDFYGIHIFGLKKDEKNYVLDGDDDSSGIFVSGSAMTPDCWTNLDISTWEDEMMDEMSQDTINAITKWFDFINDRLVDENQNPIPFNIKNIPSRLDVQGFIDYFICMQVFFMWDNTQRNMILHTRSDKKKFYPFFYDLDLSLTYASYNSDIFDRSAELSRDMSFWNTIKDSFWDEIVNRYIFLRGTVLRTDYIKNVYHSLTDIIPDSDYEKENERWGSSASKSLFNDAILLIDKRLNWLDSNYFKY